MSNPTPRRDGHPPPHINSMVSPPSHPGTSPSSPTDHDTSPAIMGGARRLLALFEDELARVAAQHKKQTDDLAARFDEFRYFAAQEQLRLVDRIHLLEAELAARGADMPPPANGGAHGPGQSGAMSDADILDVETIHLVRALARLVKGAELTTRAPREIENITLDTSHVPEPLLPALAQYLASHRMALRGLQEKNRAVERERDSLREALSMSPVSPLPPVYRKSNLVPTTPFLVPPPPRREAREVNRNSLLGAASSSASGGMPKHPRM